MPATLQDLTVEYEYTYGEYCFDGRWWWLRLIDWKRLDLQLTTHKNLKHVSFVFSHSGILRRVDKVQANAQDIEGVKRLLPHAVAEGLLEFTSRTSLSDPYSGVRLTPSADEEHDEAPSASEESDS